MFQFSRGILKYMGWGRIIQLYNILKIETLVSVYAIVLSRYVFISKKGSWNIRYYLNIFERKLTIFLLVFETKFCKTKEVDENIQRN